MAQSERGGLDFGRAKPADPSARARARAILKDAARFFHEGKSRTKIRKFVAQMCPMDKSGWGYFSFFWRPGRTHGTPEGGLEEEPSAWHVWLACVFKAFSKRLQSVFKASSKRFQRVIYPRLLPDDCWSKNAFREENLLAPDKSMGVIWTPPTAELSQKMFF